MQQCRGEFLRAATRSWFGSPSRLIFYRAGAKRVFPWMERNCVGQLELGQEGVRPCGHAGRALLRFALECALECALGWRHRPKPPSAPGCFTVRPARWFGSTSPSSRHSPPNHGRAITAPLKPKSKPPGIASRTRPPRPRKSSKPPNKGDDRSGRTRTDQISAGQDRAAPR